MYKVMCGKKQRKKQTPDDDFMGFFPLNIFFLLLITLANYTSLAWCPVIYKDAWLVAIGEKVQPFIRMHE